QASLVSRVDVFRSQVGGLRTHHGVLSNRSMWVLGRVRRSLVLPGRAPAKLERRRRPVDGKEQPLTRDAPEVGDATLAELDSGTRDQILDGARDEHLPGFRFGCDAGPDMHGYATDFAADKFTFAG